MTRRIVWISVVAAALLVLLGAWFVAKFEPVPVDQWTPPGKEARRNSFLAMERFLAAMGRPLVRTENAALLDKLPAGGVFILDQDRRAHMSPARVEALLAWVENGGYLIVVPEFSGEDDPVVDFFEVNCGCSTEKSDDEATPKKKKAPPPKTIDVTLPGGARPFKVDFHWGRMRPGKREPEWQAGAPDSRQVLLHFRHGSGQVTMVSGFSPLFDNRNIGNRDHAELLWTLLETYQPDRSRPITLMTRLSTVTLWDWLAESAWTAVVSGAALLILWLWSIIPRFGPARPEPEPSRRQLGEHLAAVGRYIWRAGGLEFWLETARESFRSRLAQRHPGLAALAPKEQALALANLSQRPASLIAAALHEPASSPQSFTQALRTLRNLERIL